MSSVDTKQWAKDCLGHPAPGTDCDLCMASKSIRRPAVADRKVGGMWAYVCEFCKYRILEHEAKTARLYRRSS